MNAAAEIALAVDASPADASLLIAWADALEDEGCECSRGLRMLANGHRRKWGQRMLPARVPFCRNVRVGHVPEPSVKMEFEIVVRRSWVWVFASNMIRGAPQWRGSALPFSVIRPVIWFRASEAFAAAASAAIQWSEQQRWEIP